MADNQSVLIDYIDLLGVQFAYGGRGPTEYDCYGLVIELNRRLGKTIPDYRSPEEGSEIEVLMGGEAKSKWTCFAHRDDYPDLDFPPSVFQPGRTIMFQVGRFGCHVGFIIRPRKFIHVWEGSGSVEVTPIHRDWKRRIIGVYEFNG